jgi:hypothetical protein
VDVREIRVAQTCVSRLMTEVIRPAAILREDVGRRVVVELALQNVHSGGLWWSEPSNWRRYTLPWDGADNGPGSSELLGTMQIAYGVPTRFDITIYRATITPTGQGYGLTVQGLCDEALAFGGLSLKTCPRADLLPPPKAFRLAS